MCELLRAAPPGCGANAARRGMVSACQHTPRASETARVLVRAIRLGFLRGTLEILSNAGDRAEAGGLGWAASTIAAQQRACSPVVWQPLWQRTSSIAQTGCQVLASTCVGPCRVYVLKRVRGDCVYFCGSSRTTPLQICHSASPSVGIPGSRREAAWLSAQPSSKVAQSRERVRCTDARSC